MAQPQVANLFLWISRDSQRVLGQHPLSAEQAYEDARNRHPQKCEGYPVQLGIFGFPPGTNPVIAIAHAFWQHVPPTGIEGLGKPEPKPALAPVPKDSETKEQDQEDTKPMKKAKLA